MVKALKAHDKPQTIYQSLFEATKRTLCFPTLYKDVISQT